MSPRAADVIVVGGGAAGLMAAIAAAEQAETLLVTDGPLGRSNAVMAQGGLHALGAEPGSEEKLKADMRASARTPLDEARLAAFVAAIPETIAALERWGLAFDRDDSGALKRRRAGGLSEPRILSAGDRIGPALFRVLKRRFEASGAGLMTRAAATGLARQEGGLRLDLTGGRSLRCRSLVVCTGGRSLLEARSRGVPCTNPENDNHRFYQVLAGLGLEELDPEAFQYQPFGLIDPDTGARRLCVPETITNLPVRLLDRDGAELCPLTRDRLALTEALFAAREAGRGITLADGRVGFRLTTSAIPPALLTQELPKLAALLARRGRLGGDVLVFPFLHFQLGGFRVSPRGETAIPGLFLAGEMTGGLHGLNRLMGIGLTDSLVHGRLAGQAAAARASLSAE